MRWQSMESYRQFIRECEGLFLLALSLAKVDPAGKARWLRAERKREWRRMKRLGLPVTLHFEDEPEAHRRAGCCVQP